MIIGVLIFAVNDQPGWNSVSSAVKVLKQEGTVFVHSHVVIVYRDS